MLKKEGLEFMKRFHLPYKYKYMLQENQSVGEKWYFQTCEVVQATTVEDT